MKNSSFLSPWPLPVLILLGAFAASAQPVLPTVDELLTQIETNDNPNSAPLAAVLRQRLQENKLVIRFDAESFAEKDNSCGTIGFLGAPVPTVYLNPDPECGPIAKYVSTVIHEYEHIRILEEEVFEDLIAAHESGTDLSTDDIPAKALDYARGTAYLLGVSPPPGRNDSPAEVERLKRVALLFQVYTETRAYLTARTHAGSHVAEAWDDDEIVRTLDVLYLKNRLTSGEVQIASAAAREAANYDDYLRRTANLRSAFALTAE